MKGPFDICLCHLSLAAEVLAPRLGRSHAGARSLADKAPLELGNGANDVRLSRAPGIPAARPTHGRCARTQ